MRRNRKAASIFVVAALLVFSPRGSQAQTSEPRLALVIGNAQYHSAPLTTSANDAGLIAQTLTAAGFEVTGAADLDQTSIRRAFRDFLDKVQAAGPHAITFVYLAGYGLQYAGDNYFVPVDASLERDTDIPVEAIRVSDFTHALAGMPVDARIFVLDAARTNPFPVKGSPLAGGLALVDVETGGLDAFNAAPGTIAPVEKGTYGAYARALAEMLSYGGVPLDEVFARTRLRVSESTQGAFVPWDVSKLTRPLALLAASPDAALPPMETYKQLQTQPIREYPNPDEAYAAAVEIDTLSAYQEFLSAFPSDPLAARVRTLLAARREALTWNRTLIADTPDAYWSYMRRYPHGPHSYDARRRLGRFSVPLDPPQRFNMYDFQGLPPPPEDEYVIIDRPVIIFGPREYPPPPPPPENFLPPPPAAFRKLPPPEPREEGGLPLQEALPLPFARPAPHPGAISQPRPAQAGAPDAAPPPPPASGTPRPNGPGPNAPNPNAGPQPPRGAPQNPAPQGGPPQGQGQGQPLTHPVPPQGQAPVQGQAPQPHPQAAPAAPAPAPAAAPHPAPQAQPAPAPAAPAVVPQAAPAHPAEPPHPVPQAQPAPAAPEVHPQHAPPQAEPPQAPVHVAPPAEVRPAEPPHPAAAPHPEPQHQEPAHPEPPHPEPPHPEPPKMESPKPPVPNAARPEHPPHPEEKKPEEKKEEGGPH